MKLVARGVRLNEFNVYDTLGLGYKAYFYSCLNIRGRYLKETSHKDNCLICPRCLIRNETMNYHVMVKIIYYPNPFGSNIIQYNFNDPNSDGSPLLVRTMIHTGQFKHNPPWMA